MPIRGAPPPPRGGMRPEADAAAATVGDAPRPAPPASTSTTRERDELQSRDAHDAHDSLPRALDADLRIRSSALSASGPTSTKVPDLLADWKQAVIVAAARDAARAELWPDAERAVRSLEQQRGAPLSEDEVDAALEDFFDRERAHLDALEHTYRAEFDKGPREREQTLQRVVLDERPRVQQLRDPFTPIARRDPAARAREVVLWENPTAMVLVDLFAPSPKALVVPKQQVMLAQDASAQLLGDVALLAAHVSDAFIDVTGAKPAGIWVNPPQDLTVKQMHVHVLPDLPDWRSFAGVPRGARPERAVHAAQDPQVAARMRDLFQNLTQALERKLGPSS